MPIKAAALFDDSTAASATKRLEAVVAMACNDSAIRWRRSFVDVFVILCGLWCKIGDSA